MFTFQRSIARVGSVLGVLLAPEFLWSIKKSPLIILFLKEMGFVVLSVVNAPVPTGYDKPGNGLPEREKLILLGSDRFYSLFKKFFNVWKPTVLVEGGEEPEADVLKVLILLIEQRENEGLIFWSRHISWA
jgi:hypothetical protein